MNDTRTSISYVAPGRSMTMSGALHFACANGNARAVRALLRAGSDPEAVLDVPEQFASLSAGLESNGIGNV